MNHKPVLSTKQIWNINLGFLGLQIAFSLVMTNTSRIFSALGADADILSILWLAPPLAGLLVQPLIGYWSDRKWTRFGRRIPFIFIGTILSFVLLLVMPNLSADTHIIYPIWDEVVLLFLLQASFNMSMLPFRSLIGDQLQKKQQNLGFSIQTFISNTGSITGSLLPFFLVFIGVRNEPLGDERLAPSLSWSFYIGGAILIATVLWTCLKTKEYQPNEYVDDTKVNTNRDHTGTSNRSVIWRLGLVQFFSWIGFFFLWVYATDAIACKIWHTTDPLSEAYNDAGNWFGVLSSIYSIISIVFATALSKLANRFGRKQIYFISLLICGLGFVSISFIENQYLLILPMLGIGMGWASILTFPFAIMASNSSAKRMGLQMGLLNITITLPQIAGALLGIVLFRYLANSDSMTMILYAGISVIISACFVLKLKRSET